MYDKILAGIRTFFICFFIFTCTYVIFDTEKYIKQKADETVTIVKDTREQTFKQITDLRTDTFLYLHDTNKVLDNRLQSIQNDLNTQLTTAEKDANNQLTETNNQLKKTNETISSLATEYSKIPKDIEIATNRFNVQTNCEINELCWQNMFTDMMIDARNTARDGAETYREMDAAIPLIAKNIQTVTDVVAKAAPEVAEDVKKTADHIQRVTTPKWYDKLFSYMVSGGVLYFTAKPMK